MKQLYDNPLGLFFDPVAQLVFSQSPQGVFGPQVAYPFQFRANNER